METQKTPNNKSNSKKKDQAGGIMLQSNHNKNSMVLAEKQ